MFFPFIDPLCRHTVTASSDYYFNTCGRSVYKIIKSSLFLFLERMCELTDTMCETNDHVLFPGLVGQYINWE